MPLGVVAIIYENRPNVTSDAAGLCLKSGNVGVPARVVGRDLVEHRHRAARCARPREGRACPTTRWCSSRTPRHEAAVEFMRLRGVIDCLIPRGGPSLIALDPRERDRAVRHRRRRQLPRLRRRARPTSTWPTTIVVNAQDAAAVGVQRGRDRCSCTQRSPRRSCRESAAALDGVELVGDDATRESLGADRSGSRPTTTTPREFLDLKLAVRVVDSLDEAIDHIDRFGTGHSEAIVTAIVAAADRGSPARSTPPRCW